MTLTLRSCNFAVTFLETPINIYLMPTRQGHGRTLVLISARVQTTLPLWSLPSPWKVMAKPLRNSMATPACPLISGVQETSIPDPHSCLYLASSDCLNLVSVKIVISVHWPIELNILLLFETILLDWPPIPPQFLVLILICDSNESLPFTPGLLWRVAGFFPPELERMLYWWIDGYCLKEWDYIRYYKKKHRIHL